MPEDRATDSDHRDGVAARRARIALVGVIAAFALLATVIAVKTPAWESNDEPDHVQNVEALGISS
jgi:hypothetical protein